MMMIHWYAGTSYVNITPTFYDGICTVEVVGYGLGAKRCHMLVAKECCYDVLSCKIQVRGWNQHKLVGTVTSDLLDIGTSSPRTRGAVPGRGAGACEHVKDDRKCVCESMYNPNIFVPFLEPGGMDRRLLLYVTMCVSVCMSVFVHGHPGMLKEDWACVVWMGVCQCRLS